MKPVLDARYVRTAGDTDPLVASLAIDGSELTSSATVVMRFRNGDTIPGTYLGGGDFSFAVAGLPEGKQVAFWIDALDGGVTITYVHGHVITLGGASA